MATNDDTKQVKILIAGQVYSLKVLIKDEKLIRRIAKEINEKIDTFQVNYPNQEQKGCMALSLLSYAIDLNKIELNPNLAASKHQMSLSKRLNDIDILLDSLLEH